MDGDVVGVETEAGAEADSVEGAEAEIQVFVVVAVEVTSEVDAEVTLEAVVEVILGVVVVISGDEAAGEISEAVEEVAGVVLGNREGSWSLLLFFTLISSDSQCIPRERPGDFGRSGHRQFSR